MKDIKYLGVWMDENSAQLIELKAGPGPASTKKLLLKFRRAEKGMKPGQGAAFAAQAPDKQAIFYQELCIVIKNYDEIVLFGPMEAKTELRNILRNDPFFLKKRIAIEHTSHMNDAQQHRFVEDYFLKY